VSLALSAALSPVALQAYSFVERLGVAALLVGVPVASSARRSRSCWPAPPRRSRYRRTNGRGAASGPLFLLLGAPLVGWPARCWSASPRHRPPGGDPDPPAVGADRGAGFLISDAPRRPLPARRRGAAGDFEATVLPFQRSGVESTVVVTRNTRSGIDILWTTEASGRHVAAGRRIPATLGRIPGEAARPSPAARPWRSTGYGPHAGPASSRAGSSTVDVAELSLGSSSQPHDSCGDEPSRAGAGLPSTSITRRSDPAADSDGVL